LTGDMVVDELRKIGFANMADYMKPTPEAAVSASNSNSTTSAPPRRPV
jgi:hypothetical protein